MVEVKPHNRWLVWLSIATALVLCLYPLAPEQRWLKPSWLTLVVIYWLWMLPQTLPQPVLFLLGLIQDIIFDSYLGQHALALVVVGYIASLSYQRIRTYGPWQQAGWVFVLVGITQMLFHWLRGLAGASVPGLHFLLPAFTSALVWPLMYLLLERWRLRLRVS